MSIRSIESAIGDQRHIKQINNNHSAANKVRKVSAVSIPLNNVMIYIDLLTSRLDLIYHVALLSISRSSPAPTTHQPPLDLAPTRATYARLFDPTRLVDSLRLKSRNSEYRLLPVSSKSPLAGTQDSNDDVLYLWARLMEGLFRSLGQTQLMANLGD